MNTKDFQHLIDNPEFAAGRVVDLEDAIKSALYYLGDDELVVDILKDVLNDK